MLAADNRPLRTAIAVSLLVHAVLLSLHFAPPDSFRLKPLDAGLEIILVNARHASAPLKADALAQANLDGGGNAEAGRATSPLPDQRASNDGNALEARQRRLAELEQQQSRELAQRMQSDVQPVPLPSQTNTTPPNSVTPLAAAQEDMQALARREAEIARRIEDYNKRPRKTQLTPSTREVTYALYYTAMQKRIEQIGTRYFPQQGGKKIYGELVVYIPVFQDGSLYGKEGGPRIERSSGNATLDAAALDIVRRAAPFGRFPAGLPTDGKEQVWEIITRFAFTNEEVLSTSAAGGAP
jgi:protein TonB